MNNLLFLELIEKSNEININGEEIIDLTEPILNRNQKINFNDNEREFVVGSDLLCKPTSMAKFIYGDAGKVDLLAYYNGYSNPFAMTPGRKLKIPKINELENIITATKEADKNIAKIALNKKSSIVDEKRKQKIKGDIERVNMSSTLKSTHEMGDRIILDNYNRVSNSKNIETIREEIDYFMDHFERVLKNNVS